jgi:hypothetical protein
MLGTIWVQKIYFLLGVEFLLPNLEMALAHISVSGSPIAAL